MTLVSEFHFRGKTDATGALHRKSIWMKVPAAWLRPDEASPLLDWGAAIKMI